MAKKPLLRGIWNTFFVSIAWILSYIVDVYEQLPLHLNFKPIDSKSTSAAIFRWKSDRWAMEFRW